MERLYQDVNSNGKNFEDEQNFTPSTATNIRSAYYRAQQLTQEDEHQQQLLLLSASSGGAGAPAGERGAATTVRVANAAAPAAVDHGAAPEDSNILFLSNSAAAGLQTPYYSTSSMLPITDDGGSKRRQIPTIGSKRHHNATAGSMNTTSSPSLRLRQLEHHDHPVDEEDCRNVNPMYPVADKRRDSCNTTFRRSGIKADEWHHNNKSSDYKGFGGGMSTASGMSFTNSSVGGAASGFSVQSSNFTNNAGPRPGGPRNNHGQDNMGYSLPPFSPSGHHVNPSPGVSMIPFPSFSAGMTMGTSGGMMTNSESASNGPAGRNLQHFGMHPSNSALNNTILPSNNHSTERIDVRMQQPQGGDQQLQNPWSAVNRDQHIMASNLSNHQAVSHSCDYLHQRTDAPVLAMSTCYDAQQPAMLFAQQQANRQQHQQQHHMPNTNGDLVSNPAARLGIYGRAEYQLLTDPCHAGDNYFTQGVATNPSTLSYYYQTMQSQDNNNNDGPNMANGKPPFQEFQQCDTVGVPSHDDTAPDQSE
eukprot:scaffold4569_cov284-Chaetoceros_neogracile.AAC.1